MYMVRCGGDGGSREKRERKRREAAVKRGNLCRES